MKFLYSALIAFFLSMPSSAETFVSLYKEYRAALETGNGEKILMAAKDAYKAARAEHENQDYHAVAAYNYGLAIRSPSVAREFFQESVDIFNRLYGGGDTRLLDPLWELGRSLRAGDENTKAISCYRRIEKVLDANDIDDPDLRFSLLMDFSSAHLFEYEFDSALSRLKAAEDIIPALAPREAEYRAAVAFQGGKIYSVMERKSKALNLLGQAVAGYETLVQPDDPRLLAARGFLVGLLAQMNQSEQAFAQLREIGIAQAGKEMANPEPVYRVSPEFPRKARENNWDGRVVVLFDITPEGRVENAEVIEASHDVYKKPTLKAVQQFLFAPRVVNGVTVSTHGVRYLMTFTVR